MKKSFLFPHKYRLIGIIILVPTIALWIANAYYGFSVALLEISQSTIAHSRNPDFTLDTDYTNDLAYFLALLSLCFIAFAKLKVEDEMTIQLRFQSFQISIYIALILFVGLDLFTSDLTYVFYSTLLWYIFLVIFIIIFYTKIYLLNKSAKDEK